MSLTIRPDQRHRLRRLDGVPDGSLLIHEIYRSLQGESTFAGLPCVFVRLTACNLRCVYCDTAHAFHEGEPMTVDAVVDRVLAMGDPLVELTGGEPLLQPGAVPLMARLADAGRTVLLETSGSIDTAAVDPRVRIILDLKTPGSGEVAANHWPNLPRLKATDEVKFVVADRYDFQWACACIAEHRLAERCPILMGPVFGKVTPAELAGWILDSGLPIRFQLQLHKVIWSPDARGV